jgi:hypothetical protein
MFFVRMSPNKHLKNCFKTSWLERRVYTVYIRRGQHDSELTIFCFLFLVLSNPTDFPAKIHGFSFDSHQQPRHPSLRRGGETHLVIILLLHNVFQPFLIKARFSWSQSYQTFSS